MLFCSMWANGVAKCNAKDLFEGFLKVCAEKKKLIFVLGATLNLVLSPNFCVERGLCICVRIIWEYWGLDILNVSLHHLLCFPYLLVKLCSAITRQRKLKVEPHKSLVFFLVGAWVYFLVKFSSLFPSYIWWGLLKVYNTFKINLA